MAECGRCQAKHLYKNEMISANYFDAGQQFNEFNMLLQYQIGAG